LSEALGESVNSSDIVIEKALGELNRFSLVRLTSETVSVHRLLQAVEQDALASEERGHWLLRALKLFDAFAPDRPYEVGTWGNWLALSTHAETLLGHAEDQGLDTLLVARMANEFGSFLQARAAYAQAAPHYERALRIREQALGPDHPDVATSLNNLALLYRAQGRYEQAAPLLKRALAIRERALGPDHPDVAASLENCVLLLRTVGRPEEATSLEARARVI
jgi:tetratricopeptide (TPR) repeat protein